MPDRGEGVDGLALQQDVDLDQVRLLLPRLLVVQRGVAAGARLQGVEEVEDDLGERHRVAQLDPRLRQVVHAAELAAPPLAQLHDRADELRRRQHRHLHHRLEDLGDLARRPVRRVRHRQLGAVVLDHAVDDVRRGGDQVEPGLALQAVAGDLQVQQAEEAAAEAEPERRGRLGLVGQRRVVELELVQRLAQVRVLRAVDGVEPRVDHRPRLPVARQRFRRAVPLAGHGVAALALADVLHPGDEVADLADPPPRAGLGLRGDDAHLEQLVRGAGGHHLDALARRDPAVDDADVGDDAAVGVVDGVEDHRPGGGVGAARGGRGAGGPPLGPRASLGRRDAGDHLVEQLAHAVPGLRADPQHVAGVAADDVGDLGGVAVRVGGGQVDLVEDRDDGEVLLQRQVEVGQRLGLDALRGVDEQDRALARLERPRDLVGEVDVPRGVDEVQDDLLVGAVLPAHRPRQPDVLRLDRDAALALDVHAVEVLRAHVPSLDHPGELQHAVGQGGLAVVDVGDDAEVPDPRRRGEGLVGERGHSGSTS